MQGACKIIDRRRSGYKSIDKHILSCLSEYTQSFPVSVYIFTAVFSFLVPEKKNPSGSERIVRSCLDINGENKTEKATIKQTCRIYVDVGTCIQPVFTWIYAADDEPLLLRGLLWIDRNIPRCRWSDWKVIAPTLTPRTRRVTSFPPETLIINK